MAFRVAKEKKKQIDFKTVEKIGNFGIVGKRTWELRYGSWNGNELKYDLRMWSYDEDGSEIPGKGICLGGEEIEALYLLLKEEAEK